MLYLFVSTADQLGNLKHQLIASSSELTSPLALYRKWWDGLERGTRVAHGRHICNDNRNNVSFSRAREDEPTPLDAWSGMADTCNYVIEMNISLANDFMNDLDKVRAKLDAICSKLYAARVELLGDTFPADLPAAMNLEQLLEEDEHLFFRSAQQTFSFVDNGKRRGKEFRKNLLLHR